MDQDYEPALSRATAPAPSAPARRGFGPGVLAAVGVVALAAGFGAGWASHTSSSKTSNGSGATVAVHGTLHLGGGLDNYSTSATASGTTCSGAGGYNDISAGVAVTIGDQTGKTLGVTSLQAGHVDSGSCVFDFATSVPAGATLYTVVISHRGTQTFQPSDVATGFNMSLGS